MNAPQDESRRPIAALLVQRVYGALALTLIVALLLAMGWSVYWGNRSRVVPAAARPLALSELKALPGSPENELSARLKGIGHDEARKLNAAMPFAPAAGKPASPFRFAGSFADRVRATECLAIAAMAEAGHGDVDQRAVIQVILNRVRHPAFAKTVCGVVFQGSHRSTGCQFTFTCDGALARRYSAASWASARYRANEALDGAVFAPVGLATHYHTDWVHPYWSASLTKLARIDTHLFFRWPGHWGNLNAIAVLYRGGEPAIAKLAYLPGHSDAAETPGAEAFASQTTSAVALLDVVVRNEDGGAFVLLTGAPSAASAREMGRSICMDRPSCKVFGWFERSAIPSGYPVPASARAQLGFSYFRDGRKDEIVLYDCARFASVAADGCIPAGMRGPRRPKPAPAAVTVASLPSAAGKVGVSTQ